MYGLTNKSLSVTKTASKTNIDNNNILLNNKIYDFFLFNNSGICILEKQLEKIYLNPNQYNNYKQIIKNLANIFLINYQNCKISEEKENTEKISLNENKKYAKDNEFIFKFIQLEKYKLLFMIRNNIIFVTTFPKHASTQFQKLLLIHIFIALINFKGDIISAIRNFNKYEKFDNNNFINLKTIYKKNTNLPSKELNDILEILIFENYFLKIIISHFSKVFNEMFKKEFLNLTQTRFKNLYILDISNSSIILDMRKVQGNKNENIIKSYNINPKLLEEILYHSKNMFDSYVKENEMRFVATDSLFRFVKFECTSTYPRLLFIIKFIPVLKGIAVIHLYYQKKLSRNMENNVFEQEAKYKEIDLLFGSFIRNNQNIEFKYGAPKKLQHIEKFFEEFFVTCRNGFDIFKINNNKKLKYVNYQIINIINSVPISNDGNIDKLFSDINAKLEEEYNKELDTKREKEKANEENEEKEDENENENEEENTIENLFLLSKESIYNEILNSKNNDINNNNKKPQLIMNLNKKQISKIFMDSVEKSLITDDDKKYNEIENNKTAKIEIKKNVNSNINIDKLIYTEENTERKNLLQKSNQTSLNNSNFSSFSMISEVKTKERFKIKIYNSKTRLIKDNNIYNNNPNEKDYKLSELLDITDINMKKSKLNSQNDFIYNKNKRDKKDNNDLFKNTETKNLIINSISNMNN